ncbi:MAG TPA: type I restriction enzyme HsdR N-terminal domain-containing protein, partial [bacterium]|nr:type I restriction enzyme HsdR N-terminal domain-containing protein [bacterium]
MISESSWPNFENLSLQNEADVETRFIYPLVQALGFETNEIYSKVPIEFNEGKKGRKHEADFVLAPGGQKQLEKTWIVIETKSPKEELQKAQKQVESYVRHLKAPFFLKTNGKDLEVWKNPPYSQDQLIFNSKISNLFNKRGELERILSREVVRNFLEKFEETKSIVKNVNAQDYFKFLSEFAFDGLIAPRKLISGENEKDIVTIDETTDPGTFFDNRKLLVIQGLGGYGKTTVIKMILRKTFKELELNSFPLRIILNNETKSLVASIRKSLNSFSVGLDSDEALVDWLKNNKNLIIFDDWEKLPEIRRDLFEEEIRELLLTQSWIVISTRPTEKFIKADFRLLKIVKYSEEERNEVIKINFLDESWLQENPDKIFGKIDEGLKDLLFVPVFLEIYIKLVKRTPYGSLERPHNVTELMDKLLDRSLEKSLLLKSSEVIACCNKLVNSGKNYYLINEIEDARKACGASFSPSDFAQAMKECGVFSEFSPGIYSFGHDVWNIYFKYRSFFKEL